MQFVGQSIQLSDNALEFIRKIAMLFFQLPVLILMMLMCVSERLNLLRISTNSMGMQVDVLNVHVQENRG